jgi:hypothetical protein
MGPTNVRSPGSELPLTGQTVSRQYSTTETVKMHVSHNSVQILWGIMAALLFFLLAGHGIGWIRLSFEN